MLRILIYLISFCFATTVMAADDLLIQFNRTTPKGLGNSIGTIRVTQTDYGLLFTPNLRNLTPGSYEFDIHDNPSCAQNGLAAGDDFDPNHTHLHLGPYNPNGHLGDLPKLYVASDGTAAFPVLAPRILDITEIKGHSIVIGSEKNRIACGVIAAA